MKSRTFGVIAMMALLLGVTSLTAQVTLPVAVSTLSQIPFYTYQNYYGYIDNCLNSIATFNTPSGIAIDGTGNNLYVADKNNNAVRWISLDQGYTTTFVPYPPYVPASLISSPVGVAVDTFGNVYVLNQGNGNNGTVLEFDSYGELLATNATHLTNAASMALDSSGNIYVTVNNNSLIRITGNTVSNIVTIPIAGTSLRGIVVKHNGLIAACDAGRNGIYLINPTNGVVTTNTGFNGVGDSSYTVAENNLATIPTRTQFNQPSGVTEAGDGSLIVTDYGNNEVKVVSVTGLTTNLYGLNYTLWNEPLSQPKNIFPGWWDANVVIPFAVGDVEARLPFGVVLSPNGNTVYVTEDYYHLIRTVTGGGFKAPLVAPSRPSGLSAIANFGLVNLTWTASSGATSYNVKRSTTTGGPYTTIASTSGTSYNDTAVVNGTTYFYVISAVSPSGESGNSTEMTATLPTLAPPTQLAATTNYGQVNLTWAASSGAASYNVKRSPSTGGPYTTIASPTLTSYSDTSVVNGSTYYYVVSAVNTGGESSNSVEISATVPIPPPGPPTIGWYDYEGNQNTGFFSVLHPVGVSIFNNDQLIAINPTTNGVATYYIAGPTPVTNNPSALNGTTPPFYQDGLLFAQPLTLTYPTNGDLTIKAVNVGPGGSSPVTTAEFIFQVGGPTITGNNAGSFTVSDVTSNVTFYYTTDGSTPTNDGSGTAINAGTNNPQSIAINVSTTNVTVTVRAFRNGYQPSGSAIQVFSPGAFQALNTISFGFASGEASSEFIASPGQTFYAPVTLSLLSTTVMYSLQFNLTVTNINSGPPVTPGAFNFTSMLLKPDPANSGFYLQIPPYEFAGANPPASSQLVNYEGGNFVSLLTTNLSENLMGVGWLERYSETNLYNTKSQDLIQFSQDHDTLFLQSGGQVVVGGYSFQVPPGAILGQTNYQIQIGRPSATDDGIGAPGSSVFIYAPTNGSTGGGSINSIKNITIGQFKYLVGDCYPFHWFNAGDFGNTNLENADVEQVFQSAIYGLNSPGFQAPNSDFFDAMDSCGNVGALDNNNADANYGYYTNASGYPFAFTNTITNFVFNVDASSNLISATSSFLTNVTEIYISTLNFSAPYTITTNGPTWTNVTMAATSYTFPNAYVPSLFDGNDQNINQIAFGDGVLDVCDVYVTYRRSLDPSLTWFTRFWSNGSRVAQTTANVFNPSSLAKSQSLPAATPISITNTPAVNFASTDFVASAGQVLQIPITANVFGAYPLRVAMLNLSVVPLDGSPALTTPVSFTTGALGNPTSGFTDSDGNGNFAAAWLDSTITGISNSSAVIGTLNITIPTNAASLSSYAIHFDHASGSPNGIASFPKQTLTGLITLSSRTNSTYNDGIPDSWRLRWFGTVNNLLSVSNASPSGDGVNNWQKYLAGVDPNVANDFPNMSPKTTKMSGYTAINWSTIVGRKYVIESSSTLFPGNWTATSTNIATGTEMELDDNPANPSKFYRVLLLP